MSSAGTAAVERRRVSGGGSVLPDAALHGPRSLVGQLVSLGALMTVPLLLVITDVLVGDPLRHADDVIAGKSWHRAQPFLVTLAKIDGSARSSWMCSAVAAVDSWRGSCWVRRTTGLVGQHRRTGAVRRGLRSQ
jgi:hypothetical protein